MLGARAMVFDVPGLHSADSSDAIAAAANLADQIAAKAAKLDSTPFELTDRTSLFQLADAKYDASHDTIPDISPDPVAPIAQNLSQVAADALSAWNSGDSYADKLAEARETNQALRELLGPEQTDSIEQAKLREHMLTQTEQLEPLLAPDAFSTERQSPETDRVKPHPVTLNVASPSHGEVRISGLAQFFPAHTVHARQSTAVVAGDDCELTSVDHYHIRRVEVSLEPLIEPGSPGHAALQNLIKNPTDSGIAKFQDAMREIAGPPEQQRPTQASVPVRRDHVTVITSSELLQLGPESRSDLATHYLVEESELPIIDLLADNRELIRSLAAAATTDKTRSGPATRKFLRDALRCAGRADDLALLEHGDGLNTPDTLLLGLFGTDIVDRASVVMIGNGNRLDPDMKVHRGRLSGSTARDGIHRIREHAAPTQADPLPRPGHAPPSQPAPPDLASPRAGGQTPAPSLRPRSRF